MGRMGLHIDEVDAHCGCDLDSGEREWEGGRGRWDGRGGGDERAVKKRKRGRKTMSKHPLPL
jgi:hypothetical protein